MSRQRPPKTLNLARVYKVSSFQRIFLIISWISSTKGGYKMLTFGGLSKHLLIKKRNGLIPWNQKCRICNHDETECVKAGRGRSGERNILCLKKIVEKEPSNFYLESVKKHTIYSISLNSNCSAKFNQLLWKFSNHSAIYLVL